MAAHKVANISDIEEGNCKTVTVNGQSIALYNIKGKFYATDNTCKHKGGPLGEGSLDGEIVTCPLHGWTYNVTTGKCEMNPELQLDTYPVKIEGEDIIIEA